jgi:hypothetical protein
LLKAELGRVERVKLKEQGDGSQIPEFRRKTKNNYYNLLATDYLP